MVISLDFRRSCPESVTVVVSPLAELLACLHILAEPEHHPESIRWGEEARASISTALAIAIADFSPLWARYRCRALLPLAPRRELTLGEELEELRALPLDVFTSLAADGVYGLGRRDEGGPRVFGDREWKAFIEASYRRSFSRGDLARRLASNAGDFRDELIDVLTRCDQAFFGRWWSQVHPRLAETSNILSRDLATCPASEVVAGISETGHLLADGRVRFDKLETDSLLVGERSLILVPSLRGWPHLTVKAEEPWAITVVFSVQNAPRSLTIGQFVGRIEVLASPSRLELCRHLVGEPITTSELASKTNQTTPQVSRAIAKLRAAGLVTSERSGRYVHHRLETSSIMQLGQDLFATITR